MGQASPLGGMRDNLAKHVERLSYFGDYRACFRHYRQMKIV